MFSFSAGVHPSSSAISSQHLLAQARAHKAVENLEEAKKSYRDAVEKAQAEHEKNPGDQKVKEAFDAIHNEFFTFLRGLQEQNAATNLEEPSHTSPSFPQQNPSLPINRNDTATPRPRSAPRAQEVEACIAALSTSIRPSFSEKWPSPRELISAQTITSTSMPARQLPVISPEQEKSELVDYLFEEALLTLGSLEVPNKPGLFLVYAHDNPAHGQAKASTSKYLIDKLSTIRVNLYSDQAPMAQPYSSSPEDLKKDGKLEDILTSQLCLLPDPLRDDVKPVDKVVVCCSELLGSYLGWSHYEKFYQQIQEAYLKDREAYRKDGEQSGASAIRAVVRAFSQEQAYKAEFHHVLTEMAFLQIRAEQLKDQHGIIPVSLTPHSYEQCLAHFIPATTVRMEDILRFDEQAKAGQEVYPNQSLHWVLFKLIERLLVSSDEAKTCLDKFWQGYSDFIFRLKRKPSIPSALEFAQLLSSIFSGINTALLKRLASTVQQAQKQLPPNVSLIDLRTALYQHYQLSNLSIQRVSGQEMSLDDCYINLAIVESNAQREKDKEELEKQAKAFERLPSGERLEATNLNKLIPLDQLFMKQKLRNGSEATPKRILIQGRAGIGKTTLCKKLVYEYLHNKRWQDQFDCVLWVPLRQLKTSSPQRLEDLLCNQYFRSHEKSRAEALAKAFCDHRDKALFILDGLDEVISELDDHSLLKGFLEELLNQKHVVITSRPAGVDTRAFGQLDLELETIGFSPENVQAYIEKFAPPSTQAAIQQFINRTPIVQGLVNIPIQLDALCYSWNRLPKNQAVTMSMLYEAMVDKLWRKDGVRLEKKDQGEILAPSVIQVSSKTKLEKLMAAEIYYLGYLAFKGLKEDGKIEFSVGELDQRQEELEESLLRITLPFRFTADLKKASFLHTADAEHPESERYYHFLHLTFQEFFAAKFLVHHLQAYSEAKGISGLVLNQEQLHTFIAQHKYHPRYEVVWWMVAGLLKGVELEYFFALLEEEPRDLIGIRHQQVMMGCLNEARTQLNKTRIGWLETELMQWLRFEMKFRGGLSELGRQMAFPEHLLLKCLAKLEGSQKDIIRTLGKRPALSDDAISALIDALQDEDSSARSEAAYALGAQKMLPDDTISALIDALQDEDSSVMSAAAYALGAQKMLPDDTISALIDALQDEDSSVMSAAAQVLGKQKRLPDDAMQALIVTLQNKERDVRKAVAGLDEQKTLPDTAIGALIDTLQELQYKERAVRNAVAGVLGKQKTLSEEAAVQALINALQDEDSSARSEAVQVLVLALARQKMLSDDAISALITVLQDKNASIRSAAAGILGEQKTLPDTAIGALIDTLQDEDSSVRSEAAQVLGKQETLPGAAIQALITALQDEDSSVRPAAAQVLGKQETLPDDAISTLIAALQDNNASFRSAAAKALGAQKTLPGAAIQALITALQDEDSSVRSEAAQVLGKQETLPDDAISTLIAALQDNNASFRSAAAKTLGAQKTLPGAAIQALITALQDEDSSVRPAAAQVLGKQKTLPDDAISALITALKDNNASFRSAAAKALGAQKTLPGAAIQALITALQDEDIFSVRSAAVSALTGQKTLSEAAIQALITALQDEDRLFVSSVAAKTLGQQKTLSTDAISALIAALQDKKKEVRSAAAKVLGEQNTLSDTAIQALIAALQDKDENVSVRSAAAGALGKQETLPDTAIQALIAALQDKDENVSVRSAAAGALGKQETLPDTAIQALIAALQGKDENASVRFEATQALGKRETLPGTAIGALISALRDRNESVRSEAGSVLRKQKTLPDDAIGALISALRDRNESVRSEAGSALRKQKTLPGDAMQALIAMLGDKERDVRKAVAGVLGEQKMLPAPAISALIEALRSKDLTVISAAASALRKQETLPDDAIEALISALWDKSRVYRYEADKILGLHMDQIYTVLPNLALEQIRSLYTSFLLSRSFRESTPLYIQDHRLHFYTAAGLGQPIPITSEQIAVVTQAFKAVQTDAQITPLLE